ncbi:MerR family DNA-binding transcriptional regulator [Kutzneria albida]|uniref:MerR family regulatory protein n=1 Tax=Kutzneria albida DSM 43870 TaxID=1449976 RepID=W5W4Q0_9PSEU|nr:MerR family DNA-binding transcriptional regulator [Kutzneria albida]AHH95750.1 MerR family regulatory protein [Kutzneria albida DSM 43870]
MRIGEVARRAGVSAKAVRRYEALGLIAPRRLANGYRAFDERDVRVVCELRVLRELGIPAERTRPFLECLESGAELADDCPSSMAEYRTAIEELTHRIEDLTARRDRLVVRLRNAAYRSSCAAPADAASSAPTGYLDAAAEDLVGRHMPAVALTATTGARVGLAELGFGRSVIYLYPLTGRPDVDLPEGWDTIPGARGCTAEACGFRDHHREVIDAGATAVYGLSSQSVAYQREVVTRLRLPFSMLSDPGLELAALLGLPTFEAGGTRLYARITLIVRNGVIEHVFHPIDSPGEHAGQVLTWLKGTP